jgi:hypothetical protein
VAATLAFWGLSVFGFVTVQMSRRACEPLVYRMHHTWRPINRDNHGTLHVQHIAAAQCSHCLELRVCVLSWLLFHTMARTVWQSAGNDRPVTPAHVHYTALGVLWAAILEALFRRLLACFGALIMPVSAHGLANQPTFCTSRCHSTSCAGTTTRPSAPVQAIQLICGKSDARVVDPVGLLDGPLIH